MKNFFVLGAAALALCAGPSLAQPQPVSQGGVTYLSGGVTVDERQYMESQARNYNLLITNANPAGHLSVDADISIKGKDGREVVTTDNAGPLLYIKLAPGDYTITAMSGEQQQRRVIKVPAKGAKRVYFTWQQD
jgi:hypothetical protein